VRGHLPPLLPASRYTPSPGLLNMPAVLAALLSHMTHLRQLLLLPPDRAAVAPWEGPWPLELSYVPVFQPQGLAPALLVPCWPEQGGWWAQAQVGGGARGGVKGGWVGRDDFWRMLVYAVSCWGTRAPPLGMPCSTVSVPRCVCPCPGHQLTWNVACLLQLLLRHLQLPLPSVRHLDVSWQDLSDQQLAALVHPGLVTLAAAGTSAAGMTFMLLGTVWAAHDSASLGHAANSCGSNSSSSGSMTDSSSSAGPPGTSASSRKQGTGGAAAAGAQRGRTMVHRRSSNGAVDNAGASDLHPQPQQGSQPQHTLSQQETGGGRTSALVATAASAAGTAVQTGPSTAGAGPAVAAVAAAGVDGLRPALLWGSHLAAPALQRLDLSSCPCLSQGSAAAGAFHLLRAALGRLVHLAGELFE
jgi:hypothetical protein